MNRQLTVKQLPETERPYEKLMQRGAQYLSDAELLAIFIRNGYKGVRSMDIASQLLNISEGGLLNLYRLSIDEMLQIRGIGKVKAIELKAVAELSERISRQKHRDGIILNNAASVAAYYMETLRHEAREKLVLCMFDSKCSLLCDTVLSVGTVNASLISPREIYHEALMHHAVHILLLHNHPSGNALPSQQDIEVTQRVSQCGKLLELQLSDHIIIGDNKYFSFREKGLL